MTVTPRIAHFTANCMSAGNAAEFAAEAERTCGATNITRKGRVVEFDAEAVDDQGESRIGDVHESARYYGGDRTKLTQTFTTPIKHEETVMTTTPKPAARKVAAAEKATPAKVTAPITPAAEKPATAAKATAAKAAPAKATPAPAKATPAPAKATPAPAKAAPAKVKPTTVKEMTREQKRAVAAVLIAAAADMLSNFGAVAAKQSAEVTADLEGVSAKVAGELVGTWLSYCPGTAWNAALGERPRSSAK